MLIFLVAYPKLNLPENLTALVSSVKFNKLSPSQTPQGIAAIVKIKDISRETAGLIKKARRVIVADNISDPGNLGTIIRTAAAFGYDMVVCIGECAEIYNPKTVRATQGGLFTIPIIEIGNSFEFLKLFASQFNIITFSDSAKKPLSKTPRIKRPALVLGGETTGIDPKIEKQADYRFHIEQTDRVDSLNVAVAAGVAMYKFYRGYGR